MVGAVAIETGLVRMEALTVDLEPVCMGLQSQLLNFQDFLKLVAQNKRKLSCRGRWAHISVVERLLTWPARGRV